VEGLIVKSEKSAASTGITRVIRLKFAGENKKEELPNQAKSLVFQIVQAQFQAQNQFDESLRQSS
jgi:hypothetical protein